MLNISSSNSFKSDVVLRVLKKKIVFNSVHGFSEEMYLINVLKWHNLTFQTSEGVLYPQFSFGINENDYTSA